MENYQRVQLQCALLCITDEIKRICDKHDIKYFIDCGSMLGAIRHKGFIPWDDDMDIGMSPKNYKKFLSVAPKELADDFFLENYRSNSNCAFVYSKLRLKGTKYIEKKGNANAVHNEIFVDIFPYFNVSNSKKKQRRDGLILGILCQALMSKKGSRIWIDEGFKTKMKFMPVTILGHVFSTHFLRSCINARYHKYKGTDYYTIFDGKRKSFQNYIIPVSCFKRFITVPFENRLYPIPEKYDVFLKTNYGDYMVIPPKEKQVTHGIQEISFGKYHFDPDSKLMISE